MITANMFFNRVRYPGCIKTGDWETYKKMVIIPEMDRRLISQQGIDKTKPMKAYVNHGRWLVKCECGGCEKAWEESLMMCMNCLNAGHGHKYRRTMFPKQRKMIELLLLLRPEPNRNWNNASDRKRLGRDETITDLELENMVHKVEMIGGA